MTRTKIKSFLLALLVVLGVVFVCSDSFAGSVTEGCKTVPERLAEMKSCVLCPLFEVIIKTDQTIATKSYDALASSFRNVIVMVLALFIGYHTLILVSSFTKQDAPKYIGTLLLQTFKVLVAVFLLTDASYIYNYLINPLMNAGLEFGRALLFKGDGGDGTGAVLVESFKSAVNAAKGQMPTGVIGTDLLANIMGSVRMFSEAAAELPAIGGALMCISTHEGTSFLINFEMFFQGLAIYVFGWAIALACCFYLLDSAVRFGIFCVLLPFLIASWPFKITFKYTKTGWDIFMNTFFNFVMIGLVISLSTELLTQAIGGGKGGLDELEAAMNGNDVDKLKNMVSITGMDFLILIACGLFAFKLVGQINALATEMAGGGGSSANIGGKLGGLAAQGVKKAAGTAVKAGGAIGGAVYEGTGAKGKVDGMKDKAMDKMADWGAKVGLGNKANPGGAGGSNSSGSGSSSGGSGGGSGQGGSN